MLRALLALLLLANALFFAWTQGWLAAVAGTPGHGEREPERLAAQVRPEAIVVLSPGAAARALSEAQAAAVGPACLEAGPYGDAEIDAASATLAAAGLPEGPWKRETVPGAGPSWVVVATRPADAASRERRLDELKRLKASVESTEGSADVGGAFVLARHSSRDAAQVAIGTLAAAASDGLVRDLKVVALPPQTAQHWLRATDADAELQGRLFAVGGFRPCAARR